MANYLFYFWKIRLFLSENVGFNQVMDALD